MSALNKVKLSQYEVLFNSGEIQYFHVSKKEVIYTMVSEKLIKEIKEV